MPMNSEMRDRLPVSVVIIAHNEAKNLARCLSSVADWVSEIVVLINDSTDRTREIAESFRAKVFEDSWHGYRTQKNLALSFATQPWIFALDADEAVSKPLAASIQQFLRSDPRENGAYFPRCMHFMGKWIRHGDWYPDYSLRLFRRGYGHWVGGDVHERLELSGGKRRLRGDLQHYSYDDFSDQLLRMHRYGELMARSGQKKRRSGWGIACHSLWKFFRSYAFRLGFLDGFPGFYIALSQSFGVAYNYARAREVADLQRDT